MKERYKAVNGILKSSASDSTSCTQYSLAQLGKVFSTAVSCGSLKHLHIAMVKSNPIQDMPPHIRRRKQKKKKSWFFCVVLQRTSLQQPRDSSPADISPTKPFRPVYLIHGTVSLALSLGNVFSNRRYTKHTASC
jgi:hypothetical protein